MDNIPEYSAIAIIVIFLLKEAFALIREKTHKKNGEDIATRVAVIEEKLSNHCLHLDKELTTIRGDIKTIASEIIDIRLKIK